jgi:hypothetical protein
MNLLPGGVEMLDSLKGLEVNNLSMPANRSQSNW